MVLIVSSAGMHGTPSLRGMRRRDIAMCMSFRHPVEYTSMDAFLGGGKHPWTFIVFISAPIQVS